MASVAKRSWTNPRGQTVFAYVVRYKEGGKHRSKQFDRKKEADYYRRKVENELESGIHVAAREAVTVRQAAETFIRATEDRWRDGRIGQGRHAQIRCALDVSIVPMLGDRVMNDVRPVDIEAFYNRMRREGGRAGGIGPHTAHTRLTVLGLLFEHAIKHGGCARNPVPAGRKELRGTVRKPIRTFTQEEVQRILAAVETRAFRCQERPHQITRAAVHLAAFCGLRLGEILGLTLADLDLDRRVIHVRHSLTIWDELKAPKTAAGVRDVPMPAHIASHLREYRERFYQPNDRCILFRARDGGPVLHSVFNLTYWHPVLRRAGLYDADDKRHFHALRHFASSWMIANGLPLPDVAGLLGHRKFDTTLQVYAHSIVGGHQRHDAFERMADRLAALPSAAIEGELTSV